MDLVCSWVAPRSIETLISEIDATLDDCQNDKPSASENVIQELNSRLVGFYESRFKCNINS